jgi:E3 ubiquitin-protein ligase UBR1
MEEHSANENSSPSILKTYLNDTPNLFEYVVNNATRRAVLIECYQSLWGHKEEFKRTYFVPDDLAFEKLMETNGSSLLALNRSKRDLSNGTNSLLETSEIEAEYQPSQRGKQCGHVFQKGETVYRCRYVEHLNSSMDYYWN